MPPIALLEIAWTGYGMHTRHIHLTCHIVLQVPSMFEEKDLVAMFGMFDVTGFVSPFAVPPCPRTRSCYQDLWIQCVCLSERSP